MRLWQDDRRRVPCRASTLRRPAPAAGIGPCAALSRPSSTAGRRIGCGNRSPDCTTRRQPPGSGRRASRRQAHRAGHVRRAAPTARPHPCLDRSRSDPQDLTTHRRHDMHKRQFIRTGLALAAGMGLAFASHAQEWKPTKPINLIVPWAAGGSTDQVTRVTAAELEKVLGQKIVVVNQPGASGSIGTKGVWDAPARRLHLGRRRRPGPGRVPGARHAGRAGEGLEPVPQRRQCAGRRRPCRRAVPDDGAAARGDEGQAGAGQGRHGRRGLVELQRDRADRQGGRRHLPARRRTTAATRR